VHDKYSTIRRMASAVLAVLLLAPLVNAADVTGGWAGSAELKTPDGESQSIPVQAEFKQQNGEITGTIGKEAEDHFPIEKGKIEDNKLTFEFTAPEGSGTRLYTVTLTVVSATQLQGEFGFKVEDNTITGKFNLTRNK
jgi:hypothetical protein